MVESTEGNAYRAVKPFDANGTSSVADGYATAGTGRTMGFRRAIDGHRMSVTSYSISFPHCTHPGCGCRANNSRYGPGLQASTIS